MKPLDDPSLCVVGLARPVRLGHDLLQAPEKLLLFLSEQLRTLDVGQLDCVAPELHRSGRQLRSRDIQARKLVHYRIWFRSRPRERVRSAELRRWPLHRSAQNVERRRDVRGQAGDTSFNCLPDGLRPTHIWVEPLREVSHNWWHEVGNSTLNEALYLGLFVGLYAISGCNSIV
jgi:hypothetical protein